MFVIYLIVLFCVADIKSDNSAELFKLLPEKEKEDFLEKIARRILHEVETKENKTNNGNVVKTQTKKPDIFMRKALEEPENMKKISSNKTIMSSSAQRSKKVAPPVKRKKYEHNPEQYIDLTFSSDNARGKRDSNRKVFSELGPDSDSSKEKNIKSEEDFQVRNFRKKSNSKRLVKSQDDVTVTTMRATREMNNEMERIITKKPNFRRHQNKHSKQNKSNVTLDFENSSDDKHFSAINVTTQITGNTNEIEQTTIQNADTYDITDAPFTSLNDNKNPLEMSESLQSNENLKLDGTLDSKDTVIVSTPLPYDTTEKFLTSSEKYSLQDTLPTEESKHHNENLNAYASHSLEETVYLSSNKSINNKNILSSKNSRNNDSDTITKQIVSDNLKVFEEGKKYELNNVLTATPIKVLHSYENTTENLGIDTTTIKLEVLTSPISKDDVAKSENKKKYSKHSVKNSKMTKSKANSNITASSMKSSLDSAKDVLIHNLSKRNQINDNKSLKQEYRVYEIGPDVPPFIKQETRIKNPRKQNDLKKYVNDRERLKDYKLQTDNKLKGRSKNENRFYTQTLANDYVNTLYNFVPTENMKKKAASNKHKKIFDANYLLTQMPYIYSSKLFVPGNANRPNIENDDKLVSTYNDLELESDIENEKYNYNYFNAMKKQKRIQWPLIKDFDDINDGQNIETKHTKHNTENDKNALIKLLQFIKNSIADVKNNDLTYRSDINNVPVDDFDESSELSKDNILRCKYKQKCGQATDSEEVKNKQESDESKALDTSEIFDNTMSKIRHMMLVSGHFVLEKPINFSKLDAFFESAEKPQERSKELLRSILDENKKKHDVETLNKNADSVIKLNNKLSSLKRYVSKDKEYEYRLVKQFAEELMDPEIEKLYLQMEMIEKLNLRESEIGEEMEILVKILQDMVNNNDKGLVNYDWLATTVDVQSAIRKMVDMVESIRHNKDIHPSDLELLKYLVWLHTSAKQDLDQKFITPSQNTKPTSVRENHEQMLNENSILSWMMRKSRPIADDALDTFHMFLEDLQDSLLELHTAMKFISMVTTYDNQHWFEYLKQTHIDTSRKKILELTLHIAAARLFTLIEESAKNGPEDYSRGYVKKNEREVQRTREEWGFVLDLLSELKRL